MRRLTVLLMATFCAAVLASGCTKKENVIKVAVVAQMTGAEAKMGNDFKNGVSIAVDEWNSKGGVLGKKIEVLTGDDQADPKQAVSVANKMVNEGAAGIIGHFNSSCSIPASDVYTRANIPMITPASTNPLLTERGYKGVFRVCGTDDQQGKVAADFAKSKLNVKKVAILHDKTTYGQGFADLFKKHLGAAVEVVYYGGITKGDKDFKPVLTSIKEKKPDLIFFGGIYPETGLLVKQAREVNITAPFLSGDGSIDPKFVEIAGDKAAEGTYLTFSPDPDNIPAAKDFIGKYRSKFGELGPYSIYAYDAVNILLAAIKEAGTTDGKTVAEKLHSMEFSGALGKMRFTEKGDVSQSPYVVWVTRNGKFEEYWKP
ncbi:MAG: branched-chain amino acid ABC transporter substrate-binding protein [Nitrospirae bacterium]|nr:branched-chain amino acid ABC transporter substrate-binding protein [Nitrospirota bacterium]MCL5236288.1 branched-chain amino acid ABC transporter substrate-binding protein [Nitrospirota bacterium]